MFTKNLVIVMQTKQRLPAYCLTLQLSLNRRPGRSDHQLWVVWPQSYAAIAKSGSAFNF